MNITYPKLGNALKAAAAKLHKPNPWYSCSWQVEPSIRCHTNLPRYNVKLTGSGKLMEFMQPHYRTCAR